MRVYFGPKVWMGPGKADLLELIRETGSISEAGRRMGMSYKRAWTLVETLNAMFREPLVHSERGGAGGGGASLTGMGEAILALYRGFEADARKAGKGGLDALQALASVPADDT